MTYCIHILQRLAICVEQPLHNTAYVVDENSTVINTSDNSVSNNKDCIAFVYNTFVSVSDQHIVILLSDDSVDLCISFKQGVNVRHNWKPFCAT
jgi:hypothetical protein